MELKNQKEKHDELVKHVARLLQMNEEIRGINLYSSRKQLQDKIDYYEDKINEIVNQLYGLSEYEIKIIEGK